mmetsp:Transcript_138251/g.195681  ORF Transcript_138251/g.195681 Transcript_138251/m.195681 type:complete len:229 (+) Transcript_138251:329-1015(+)
MFNARRVKVILCRDRELQHYQLICRKFAEFLHHSIQKHFLRTSFVWSVDVNLWFDDWTQTTGNNSLCELKLLCNNSLNSCLVGLCDTRSHLGAKNPQSLGSLHCILKSRDRLHLLTPVLFRSKAFIALEQRDNMLLLPEICWCRQAFKLSIHRHFEQDGGNDPFTGEGRVSYNPTAHCMDHVKHIGFVFPAAVLNAISFKSFWCASTALVQRCDEAISITHVLEHVLV